MTWDREHDFEDDWGDSAEAFADFRDDGWSGEEGVAESAFHRFSDGADGGVEHGDGDSWDSYAEGLTDAYNHGWNDREDAPDTSELMREEMGWEAEGEEDEFDIRNPSASALWHSDEVVAARRRLLGEMDADAASDEEVWERFVDAEGDEADALRDELEFREQIGRENTYGDEGDRDGWETFLAGHSGDDFYDQMERNNAAWDDFTDDEKSLADDEAAREEFAEQMAEAMRGDEGDDALSKQDADDNAPNDADEDKEDKDNMGGTRGLFG